MGKKLVEFKQRFYRYISRAEYASAMAMVLGTIATSVVNSYSTYLSDRNARIERINKNPLNYIRIDYISYDTYEKMIDVRNWRPAGERLEDTKQEVVNSAKQGTFEYKKNELINMINGWLASNAKKKNTNDEIDEETLRRMQSEMESFGKNSINQTTDNLKQNNEINKSENTNNAVNDDGIKAKSEDKKQEEIDYEMVQAKSKIGELTNGKKNALPPMKKPKEKQRYFVVRECKNCATNRVLDVRLSRKKQNIKIVRNEDKPILGKIGSQEIRKDESIFDSIGRIWRAILHIKSEDKYQIIDSRFDQYGNRIKNNDIATQKEKKVKQKTNKEKDNFKETDYEILSVEFDEEDEIGEIADDANDKNINKNMLDSAQVVFSLNKKQKSEPMAQKPHFIIDGTLQEMDKYNKFGGIATNNNSNATDLQMLAYLEYTLENCWYTYAKKYKDLNLSVSLIVNYGVNADLLGIHQISQDENYKVFSAFKEDVVEAISNCDISRVKYLSNKNYKFWKTLKLTFASGK